MTKEIRKIGILGGGQLARMLAFKAQQRGLQAFILSSSKEDPASQVTSFWTQGRLDSLVDLKKFLKKVDIVTFENEFVNTKFLIEAMRKTKTPVLPHPRVIQNLQDRLFQKKWMKKYQVPTADFMKVDNLKDLEKAFRLFKGQMVLKKRMYGYDGHGTWIIKNKKDFQKIKNILRKKGSFIAEAWIPFKKELAIILATHKKNSVISLPLVETFQKDFRCYWVKGPVIHPQIKKIQAVLKSFITKIKYEGVVAFEIFQTSRDWLVNEVAPRVHNSGHYSLDALSKDQFTLHLEAILRKPIKNPRLLSPGFAMLNLLGKKEISSRWMSHSEVFFHEYGKKNMYKGRKMGHLNMMDSSKERALKQLMKIEKKYFK